MLTALLALLLCLLPSFAWASVSTTARHIISVPRRQAKVIYSYHPPIVNLLHQSLSRFPVYDRTLAHPRVPIDQVHTLRSDRHVSDTYIVHTGDTLWQLAQDHDLTVSDLQLENHLSSSMIYPGQKLLIENAHAYFTQVRRAYLHSGSLRAIRAGVPSSLLPVYEAAGVAYHIPWTILAAIHRVETDFAQSGPIVSDCGAQGPMQFMPSTFARYGVTAPGQSGSPNINNVYDAIYSTAHMLAADGYSRNPENALFLYNHSTQYVEDVQATAQSY